MTEPEKPKTIDENYILTKYDSKIKYYWASSKSNKRYYRSYRFWAIVLGALVTLISSLSAAEFIQATGWLRVFFAVLTPLLAAALTIVSGLSQTFHWGATWRDMVVCGTRLEKERDRFLATPPDKRDLQQELDVLNSIVLDETKNFFQRVLDSEIRPSENKVENSGNGGGG